MKDNETIYDTVIIGGGILGSILFHELNAVRGSKVCLVEKQCIGSNTTSLSPGYVTLNHQGFKLRTAQYAMQYYQALPPDITHFTRIPLHVVDQEMTKVAKAIRIDAKKTCEYLVMKSCLLGGSVLTNTQFLSYKTLANQLFDITCDTTKIIGKRIIFAAGTANPKWCLNAFNKCIIKSFQFDTYESRYNLNHAIIDNRHGIYLLPNNKEEIIAGFLNEDTPCDNSYHSPCMKQNHRLYTILNNHYEINRQIKSSRIAKDSFTHNEQGFIRKINSNIFLAGGLSANGITQAPFLVKTFIEQSKKSLF